MTKDLFHSCQIEKGQIKPIVYVVGCAGPVELSRVESKNEFGVHVTLVDEVP